VNNTNQTGQPESSGVGYLSIRASTAENAIPLPDVKVIIRDEDSSREILYNLVTDSSGKTDTVSIATPPKENSSYPNDSKKFAKVSIEATLSGYQPMSYFSVPIFDTIVATQNIRMVPLSDSGQNFIADYNEIMLFETENNSL